MKTITGYRRENKELRRQLEEARDALRAIHEGEVDAIVVEGGLGAQVFSLTGAETVYRLAVETMAEAAINVGPDGCIFFCNEQFAEYVRRPIEQVVGRNLTDFVPKEEEGRLRALLGQCARETVRERLVLLASDGSLKPVHLTGRALAHAGPPSLCLVAADLTELESSALQIDLLLEHQRAMEEADRALEKARADAVEEKNRLEAIMEALPVGLCIVDSLGGRVRCNPAYEQIWRDMRRLPREVSDIATYKAWWADSGEAVRPDEWASARAVEKGESVVGQLMQIERFDGTQAFVHNSAAPILDAGRRIVGGAVAIMDITRELEAQEELRKTRDSLENLINYANAPIIVWDPAFRITRFNHAVELLTGRNAADVVGKPLDILFPDESREASTALIRQTQTGKRWETVDIPILRVDGTVRTVLWNSATLYSQDGKSVTATMAQGQDVTERREAEGERRLYLKSLEFLADCATAFLRKRTSAQAFEYIAQKIAELIPGGFVIVAEQSLAEQRRIFRAVAGDERIHTTISAALGREPVGLAAPPDSLIGKNLVPGKLVRLTGGLREFASGDFPESLCQELAERHGLCGLYAIPFTWEDELLGTAVIVTGANIHARTIRVIETFVNQAAIALNRLRTDDALREREHEYRTLMEDASDGIVLADSQGFLIAANSRACEMSGFTKEELLSHPGVGLVPPEELPLLTQNLGETGVGKSAIVEHHIVRKDGSLVFVETSARRLAEGRYQAILRDITERKEAEREFTQAVQSEVFDKLIFSLRQFRHGEGLGMNLHRLALFGKNYHAIVSEPSGNKDGSPAQLNAYALSRLEIAAKEFLTIGFPRLREIASLVRVVQQDINQDAAAGDEPVFAADLSRQSDFLKAEVEELLRTARGEGDGDLAAGGEVGMRIFDQIQNIFRNIGILTAKLNEHFTSIVPEVVRTVVATLQPAPAGPALEIREDTPHVKAIISPADLGEVISVLLTNSVEALAGKAPGEGRVIVRLGAGGARARIEVEDNGGGVPEEIRSRVLVGGETTKGEGRGFGLRYAQKLLRKYGGRLTYDERYTAGARFVFELPLA